ncbi:MAG TPA: 23S rRNA (adenine(2503)-C(2))-methyltransferase RlmN [Candidatus Mcinerneyibacterium sp.]|nr:23S rRNA (adenine(2503)-C(2))-methyltransferase RlmN [Candidatus Mcinerneyibacterium sp.]
MINSNNMNNQNLLDNYQNILKELEVKSYRIDQISNWIFKKEVFDFDNMSNLPIKLRERLKKKYDILSLQIKKKERSRDGSTVKYLFKTKDNKYVEAVEMNYHNRKTLCISSQIGCKMNCSFCATGAQGFTRNLSVSEILSQIFLTGDVSNIVFMGMGEPLDNYLVLKKALKFINNEEYLNIGARKITISTIGIPEKISNLADEQKQFKISWSLHSTIKNIRNKIIPVSRKYDIDEIKNSLKYYKKLTKSSITIEYLLIRNLNMSQEEAKNLSNIAEELGAKINFIPYNEHKYSNYKRPSSNEIDKFTKYLNRKKIFYTIRDSRGKDINAACGQLAGKEKR